MAAIEVTIRQRAITQSDEIVMIVEECDKSVPSCPVPHCTRSSHNGVTKAFMLKPQVFVKNALV